jgi:hypothetical protein
MPPNGRREKAGGSEAELLAKRCGRKMGSGEAEKRGAKGIRFIVGSSKLLELLA